MKKTIQKASKRRTSRRTPEFSPGKSIRDLFGFRGTLNYFEWLFSPFKTTDNKSPVDEWKVLDHSRGPLLHGIFEKANGFGKAFRAWVQQFKENSTLFASLQSLIQKRLDSLVKDNEQLCEEFRCYFNNIKDNIPDEDMPAALKEKIDCRFQQNENCEAITLLTLWSLFRGHIRAVAFLYTEKPAVTKFEKFLEKPLLPSEISDKDKVFHYCNSQIEFCGRRTELNQLNDWLSEPNVSVWAITGPGGSGKSKLALHLARRETNKRKSVWLNSACFQTLLDCDNFEYSKQVLLICDDAMRYESDLKKLIEKVGPQRHNIKFLLLERSCEWYKSFAERSELIHEYAKKDAPIDLSKATFSDADLKKMMQDLSRARYDGKIFPDDAVKQIIEKAKKLSGDGNQIRVLFLLLLTDVYLRQEDIQNLNDADLTEKYINHSWEIIERQYGQITVNIGYRIVAYATACGGFDWENIPQVIQPYFAKITEMLDEDRSRINLFFSQLSESEIWDGVSALKPDLIGELLFCRVWNKNLMPDPQLDWLSELLPQSYSRDFLAKCLTDWPKETQKLCKTLTDTSKEVIDKNRSYCAEVFCGAVYSVYLNEERERFADYIRELDDGSSINVLRNYVLAVQILIDEDKKNRERYIDILQTIHPDEYFCETADEIFTQAEILTIVANEIEKIGKCEKALKLYQRALAILESVNDTDLQHRLKLISEEDNESAMDIIVLILRKYDLLMEAYRSIVLMCFDSNDTKQALFFYQKALELEQNNRLKHINQPFDAYGQIEGELLWRKAISCSHSISISEDLIAIDYPDEISMALADIFSIMADLNQNVGNIVHACSLLETSYALYGSIFGPEDARTISLAQKIESLKQSIDEDPDDYTYTE